MGAEHRQRFLVVDDEPLVVRSLRTTLRRRGEVVAAGSLAEGRKAMASHPTWDALLTDLRLPDGSGLELAADFRRLFPNIPVLVLSGHVEGDAANAAFDLGAEIMGKPCDSARIYEFLDGCRRHVRRPPSSAPAPSDGANETLEETIARLRSLLERPSEALTRYAVGSIIARLKREPHGAGAVQAAAEALTEDLASLYRCAKVAD
ncbi:MAG TPA: response regulator, partial [Polyangiaceae bacterium]